MEAPPSARSTYREGVLRSVARFVHVNHLQHPCVLHLLQNHFVLKVKLLLQKRADQHAVLVRDMTSFTASWRSAVLQPGVTFWLLERRQKMKNGSAFSMVVISFPRDVCETNTKCVPAQDRLFLQRRLNSTVRTSPFTPVRVSQT